MIHDIREARLARVGASRNSQNIRCGSLYFGFSEKFAIPLLLARNFASQHQKNVDVLSGTLHTAWNTQ